jgi:hypothetical protein
MVFFYYTLVVGILHLKGRYVQELGNFSTAYQGWDVFFSHDLFLIKLECLRTFQGNIVLNKIILGKKRVKKGFIKIP